MTNRIQVDSSELVERKLVALEPRYDVVFTINSSLTQPDGPTPARRAQKK